MTMTTDTTVTPITKARSKRSTVPAPDVTGTPSAALDELTGASGSTVQVDVDLLRPHPANPRRDLGDLTELADSIRAHGVRQNLLVVPDPDSDGYRLVIGHRRTAAARLAGVQTLTAIVDPTLSAADQLELMLLENIQRTDLTAVEEADAYQGLLDLGLTVATIAKRTGRSRSTVDSRLALRALPQGAQEKVHAHQATLSDAARLADFADHPEVIDDLVAHLGERNFLQHAQQVQDRLAREAAEAAVLAELAAAGVTVIKAGEYGTEPKGAQRLSALTDSTKAKPYGEPAIDPIAHATCPGHVAWLSPYDQTKATFGCQGWKAHGHQDCQRYTSEAAPVDPAERKTKITNNRAAASAETVRREWLRTDLLARTKMPADAIAYVARIVQPGGSPNYTERQLFDDLVYGDKRPTEHDQLADLVIPGRALPLLVALAVARVESQMDKTFWSSEYSRSKYAHHLSTLASWGYVLSEVEQLVVDAEVADQAKAAKAAQRRAAAS
jgi:ParB/RepB/Spo0J family partition protein